MWTRSSHCQAPVSMKSHYQQFITRLGKTKYIHLGMHSVSTVAALIHSLKLWVSLRRICANLNGRLATIQHRNQMKLTTIIQRNIAQPWVIVHLSTSKHPLAYFVIPSYIFTSYRNVQCAFISIHLKA